MENVLVSVIAGSKVLEHMRELPEADKAPCFPGQFAWNGVPVLSSDLLEPDMIAFQLMDTKSHRTILVIEKMKGL